MDVKNKNHTLTGFCPQVSRLLEAAEVGKINELAAIIGENPNVISNWNTRKKIPSKKILRASQIVFCSPIWLETGEGEMRSAEEEARWQKVSGVLNPPPETHKVTSSTQISWKNQTGKDSPSRPPAKTEQDFDWDLHNEIVTMLIELQEEMNVRIKPDKLGGLIRMIYLDEIAGIETPRRKVIELIKLAA